MNAAMTIQAASLRKGMVCIGGMGKGSARRTITRVTLGRDRLMCWDYTTQFGEAGTFRAPLRAVLAHQLPVQVLA